MGRIVWSKRLIKLLAFALLFLSSWIVFEVQGNSGSSLVPLQSRNHLILEHEPAYAQFLEEIRSFLGA